MLDSYRDSASPVWLVGDSAPADDQDVRYPLDPRHPTRHTIWTPVLDAIQDAVFRADVFQPRRLSSQSFYVRNAVTTAECKSSPQDLVTKIEELRDLYLSSAPRTIITFGSFAFQVAVAATENADQRLDFRAKDLTLAEMREAFDRRVGNDRSVVVPLLHQIVALQFAKCHAAYRMDGYDSYFEYTGFHLANRFLRLHAGDPLWR